MSAIEKKIDFMLFVTVINANGNGDPLNGNRPRTDYNGFGEISDVCIKRKLRNRMQDEGAEIFVKMAERADDGYKSLSERAAAASLTGTNEEQAKVACEKWLDVRSFGQVFAFKGKGKKGEEGSEGVSIGVRGPVSIHQAISVSPVEVHTMQITKSVNSETKEGGGKSSDTMGAKHMVRFGLYKIKGSINVQLAEKTGFSREDADLLKQCLMTIFDNDASSARPEGSMEVRKMFWWEHNSKLGQYSTARVFRSVSVKLKEGVDLPQKYEDYEITVDENVTPGLVPEICIDD